jgi:hypothetical protein
VKCIDKDGDGVEETVHYVMNVLTAAYRRNKNKPICFFKLVINPDSFGTTVENIFHVSFLVKDGYVDLSLGMCVYIYKTLRYVSIQGSSVLGLQERNRTY